MGLPFKSISEASIPDFEVVTCEFLVRVRVGNAPILRQKLIILPTAGHHTQILC